MATATQVKAKPDAIVNHRGDREYTQHYEFAAWYRSHKSKPGVVEAKLNKDCTQFTVTVESTIVDACLVSCFGGVAYGSDPGKKEIGEASSFSFSISVEDAIGRRGSEWVSQVSNKALKKIERKAKDEFVLSKRQAEQFGNEGDWNMVGHCHECVGKAARIIGLVKEYRSIRIAFWRGYRHRKLGMKLQHYSRSESYSAYTAYHDGGLYWDQRQLESEGKTVHFPRRIP